MAIGVPSNKLAKFLVPKLSSITFDELNVKDSFAFAEEIVHQDGKFLMLTHSLLTYNNVDVIEGIGKSEFEKLLQLVTQELYFMFNDILYKEKDGVAMGSPLGPTMANIFLIV